MYFVVMSASFKFLFILNLSFISLGIIIDHVRAFSTFSDDQSMLFKWATRYMTTNKIIEIIIRMIELNNTHHGTWHRLVHVKSESKEFNRVVSHMNTYVRKINKTYGFKLNSPFWREASESVVLSLIVYVNQILGKQSGALINRICVLETISNAVYVSKQIKKSEVRYLYLYIK